MVMVIRLLGDTQPVPKRPESLRTPRMAASFRVEAYRLSMQPGWQR